MDRGYRSFSRIKRGCLCKCRWQSCGECEVKLEMHFCAVLRIRELVVQTSVLRQLRCVLPTSDTNSYKYKFQAEVWTYNCANWCLMKTGRIAIERKLWRVAEEIRPSLLGLGPDSWIAVYQSYWMSMIFGGDIRYWSMVEIADIASMAISSWNVASIIAKNNGNMAGETDHQVNLAGIMMSWIRGPSKITGSSDSSSKVPNNQNPLISHSPPSRLPASELCPLFKNEP